MPHTNRKKNNAIRSKSKRILVVEDDTGWTRVTKQSNTDINGHGPNMRTTTTTTTTATATKLLHEPGVSPPLPSSSIALHRNNLIIPADASVAKTAARYKILEQRWLASESWTVLKAALISSLKPSPSPSPSIDMTIDSNSNGNSNGNASSSKQGVLHHHHSPISISTCILFGSGSPTAHAQGWIDRHHVALTQIAVFCSAVAIITEQQQQQQQQRHHYNHHPPPPPPPPRVYAQEPDYNDIDTAFLHTLGIETVHDPAGFELLLLSPSSSSSSPPSSSFVYAPGAEVNVAVRALFAQPCIYLGHELDHYYNQHSSSSSSSRSSSNGESDKDNDRRIVERFKADHGVVAIPDLDRAQDYPFHQQRLYYRLPFVVVGGGGGGGDDNDQHHHHHHTEMEV